MPNRREFLLKNASTAALASAAVLTESSHLAAQEKPAPTAPYIELVTFRLHFGSQMDRLLSWLEKRVVAILQKHQLGPMGIFTVDVGPHVPAVVFMLSYPSLAAFEAVVAKLGADQEWTTAYAELEAEGPPFFRQDFSLLRALPFSPPLKATAAGEPVHKIYELRVYEASTFRQLDFMHQRFHSGEIEVFHQCGIHPSLYADTFFGPNLPNMVYMIPFESEAHREKAWTAFRAHPDWKAIAAEWMKKSGELARNISSSILVPTSFSMIR
jgi:hypothetical protein